MTPSMVDQRHQLLAVLHHVAAVRHLDLVGGDLFKTRHQRQRHRLGLRRAGAEHQQRGQLFAAGGARRGRLVGDVVLGGDLGAERLRDAVGIDDHDHRAVAQNGVAREHVDVAQLGRHRLDDDFFGVEHAVDHDAEGLVADLRHHDEAVLRLRLGAPSSIFKQLAQMHQRQQLVAQPQDRGVLDALDLVLGIGMRPHQFDHRQLRDGEAVAGGLDDQGRDDRQGQRDLDGDAGALAGHRLDVDGAADLIDIGAHHVHADAAAGHQVTAAAVEKPGAKMNLWIWLSDHLLDVGFGGQPVGDRLGLDPLGVETAAVVGDADDDVAALMIGGESNRALLRLAGSARSAGVSRP